MKEEGSPQQPRERLTGAPGVAEQRESAVSGGLPAASFQHAQPEPVEAHRGRGGGQDEHGRALEVQGLRVEISSPTRGGEGLLGENDRHQYVQVA